MYGYDTPIYDAIRGYTGTKPLPFHMPGHKLGRGIPEAFLRDVPALDITEIPGTDNLHHPTGPIREAQELAARAFGADRTYFLVNGSTVGIHAAIAAVCGRGSRLITARDCHKSVFGGLVLSGAEPVYVMPEYNEEFGIMAAVTPESVSRALEDCPDAAGLLLTRPNYYGICCDLKAIADIVHSAGKVLIVDEAHGAHFCFGKNLPVPALEAGADICVQSAHKTLPALTQSAYLHVKGGRADLERLEFMLGVLQTSSPSYIMMTFLDVARSLMQHDGERLLGGLLADIRRFRAEAAAVEGLVFLDNSRLTGAFLDETRVVANFEKLGLTGYEAQRLLRAEYRVEVEMSDLTNVVAIATVADDTEAIERLFKALSDIGRRHGSKKALRKPRAGGFSPSPAGIGYHEALKAASESVSLFDAVGRIGKDMIAPYPPGIPLVFPGEEITQEAVAYLTEVLECGGTVEGLDEARKMRVCASI